MSLLAGLTPQLPMSDDQLRAKSLAVFHALVSTWSNDLRKEVSGLQDDLLKKLDVLQDQMSKYDENIDEERILAFVREISSLAGGGGGGDGGGRFARERAPVAHEDRRRNVADGGVDAASRGACSVRPARRAVHPQRGLLHWLEWTRFQRQSRLQRRRHQAHLGSHIGRYRFQRSHQLAWFFCW